MLKRIPLSGGDFIISKDECAYQEVIDGFPEAREISVVTFNISKRKDQVLDALKKSCAHQRLITNIPDRRDNYWNGAANEAKRTILQYLNRLDPEQFNPLSRIFFSFKNHAKIIKTDKVAYIGSANYSDESRDNWESGVILRGPAALAQIEEVIDEIERDSVRYYGDRMQKVVEPLLAARIELDEALEEFSWWPTKANRRVFVKLLTKIHESISESDAAWSMGPLRSGPITTSVDRNVLKRIGSKLTDIDELSNMIERAENGGIDAGQVAVNNDGDISDWAFQGVIDSMCRQRDDEIVEIRRLVGVFTSQIELACTQISESLGKIDNTAQGHQPSS
jgi:hypothetical protein